MSSLDIVTRTPGEPNPEIGADRYWCRISPHWTLHISIVGFKRTLCGKASDSGTLDPSDDLTRRFCAKCLYILTD
jgi:hypothetical protein